MYEFALMVSITLSRYCGLPWWAVLPAAALLPCRHSSNWPHLPQLGCARQAGEALFPAGIAFLPPCVLRPVSASPCCHQDEPWDER
jgi:hypothetical protein